MNERQFLRASELRVLGPSADYFTFQTNDEEVARTQPLEAKQNTNPMHDDLQVCLFNGFFRANYGNFHVVFNKSDLPGAFPSNPPEWKVAGPVDQEAVGYTTTDEFVAAGIQLH